jgi:hypothetical protein
MNYENHEPKTCFDLPATRGPEVLNNLESMSQANYLIWSWQNTAWWRPAGLGYTRQVARSGRYSGEEEHAICDYANAWQRAEVNEVAVEKSLLEFLETPRRWK